MLWIWSNNHFLHNKFADALNVLIWALHILDVQMDPLLIQEAADRIFEDMKNQIFIIGYISWPPRTHHWSAVCHHYLEACMVHSRESHLGMSCHFMLFSLLNICFQNVLAGALFHPLWAILLLSVLTTIGSMFATLLCMSLAPSLSQLCLWALEMTCHAIEGGSDSSTSVKAKSLAWVCLSILCLVGIVPRSGINIACGVCGVVLSNCILSAFIGCLPWTVVMCQVGETLLPWHVADYCPRSVTFFRQWLLCHFHCKKPSHCCWCHLTTSSSCLFFLWPLFSVGNNCVPSKSRLWERFLVLPFLHNGDRPTPSWWLWGCLPVAWAMMMTMGCGLFCVEILYMKW